MFTRSSLRAGLLTLAGLALLGLIAGCGGGGTNTPPPPTINTVNPIEDATKPGSVGGTVFTLMPGPDPTKPEGILDQAFDATITLTGTPDAGGAYTDTTTTVNRGGFIFHDVPAGTYTLSGTVQAPYGSPTTLTGEVRGVRVRGNIPTLMANMILFSAARSARVRGTVYSQNGQPAAGATVSVEISGYPVDYLQGPASPVYCTLSSTASTDPATPGQYDLQLPVDGINYYISAHTDSSYASDIQLQRPNRQIIDFNGTVTGGTFILSITGINSSAYSTEALNYNISNADLKIAIDGLLAAAGYVEASVTIDDGPCPTDATVSFGGAAGNSIPNMSATSSLSGTTPILSVKQDWRILQPGALRTQQDITLEPATTSLFPALNTDIVCSTLPAPTALASERAMITRLAVAHGLHATRARIDRLENLARAARSTRTTATGLIENDIYWQTNDNVSYIQGFHVYRGLQTTGNFLYLGSSQDPYQWYFFDNDPALSLDTARFYTVVSYGAGGLVSQPSQPVLLAQPLPQITVNGPADGTALPAAGNAQFSWEPVPNAQSYVLTIYPTKPTYNAAVYYEQSFPGSQTLTTVSLNSGTEYWWTVSAYNNAEPNYATAVSYATYRKITVP